MLDPNGCLESNRLTALLGALNQRAQLTIEPVVFWDCTPAVYHLQKRLDPLGTSEEEKTTSVLGFSGICQPLVLYLVFWSIWFDVVPWTIAKVFLAFLDEDETFINRGLLATGLKESNRTILIKSINAF